MSIFVRMLARPRSWSLAWRNKIRRLCEEESKSFPFLPLFISLIYNFKTCDALKPKLGVYILTKQVI